MKVNIGSAILEIVQGDITEQNTEAIVNAANNFLWMGSGVAGAIKRKGGDEIEREAMAQAPVEIGAAVISSAGKLKAKYVIHAAAMGQDLHTDAEKVKTSTFNSLKLAESKQVKSVSFPAIGTGVGGFSIFQCANIMINEAINFLQNTKHLKLVRFVLFDTQTFDAFNEELKLQFSTKRH
ncbi:MAG: macro domain-containing protein [Bacteroidetes bacterium]|nr:macro domain-containing protein [Bacteroidota bacterium]MBU1422626.1 macro domain-containing protein [Bacteroidota bacterium]MBU2471041.1 macro domain-containing protein [Bacteroidota bacterium]MBU2635728.1 macro domain-containing protein [Bacteroidota bacterium]